MPLNEDAIAVLKKQLGKQHEYVFTYKGNPISQVATRAWRKALKAAGIKEFRWHDLRHSNCSLLIAQGENIKFIQSQLGHASIQTTIDRYGHLLPVNHGAVGERMDQYIFGNPSNGCLTKQAETPEIINYQDQENMSFVEDKV